MVNDTREFEALLHVLAHGECTTVGDFAHEVLVIVAALTHVLADSADRDEPPTAAIGHVAELTARIAETAAEVVKGLMARGGPGPAGRAGHRG
jgi:hypothetical protein